MLSGGVVLDWLVSGNTFSSVFALLVRRLKIFHRKKLLLRTRAGYETASEITAVPFRDVRVSLPAKHALGL